MADPQFYNNAGPFKLADIAKKVGAELLDSAHASLAIKDVAPLHVAGPEDLSFLDNRKYVQAFRNTQAGACVVAEDVAHEAPISTAVLVTPKPYVVYAKIAQLFYPEHTSSENSISERAFVHPTAKIGKFCTVEPMAVVHDGAVIGDYTRICSGAVIGRNVSIGASCIIHPNASISYAIIGSNVIIHHGAAIGQDGFGFANDAGEHVKIPQLGKVVIEDHVEIGAHSCVDRGSGPDTIIGYGTKIDNLVQIAHNVVLGKGCIVVSQVGISGSTRIGDYVVLAGQVGIIGHLNIGSGAKVGAQSGVMHDIGPGETVLGSPAVPAKQYHRQTLAVQNLAKERRKSYGNDENR